MDKAVIMSIIVVVLVVSGISYSVQRTFSPKPSENQSATPSSTQTEQGGTASEENSLEVISSEESSPPDSSSETSGTTTSQLIYNFTGKWSGKYKVSLPKECTKFSGSWTASLTQKGDSFSGSYKSSVNGDVIGTTLDIKTFNSQLSGKIKAKLDGSITGDSMAGTFTGPTCPGTSKQTTGTFSGLKDK